MLARVIEEIGLNAREHFLILMPTLLTSVRDNDSTVATKSIITGAHILGSVLYELSLQVPFISFVQQVYMSVQRFDFKYLCF